MCRRALFDDFCLPSSLKHALNAQNVSETSSDESGKQKEVKIGTWGEISFINNDSDGLKNYSLNKDIVPGRLLRDGKLPLLPSVHTSNKRTSNRKERLTSPAAVISDKDTVATISAHSSAGLLISSSLGKSDLQIGSYESRDESSSSNSESVSLCEEGKVTTLSGSIKSFGSGSDETLRVRHSQSARAKTHSPSFLLSGENNAVDLISIGKTKLTDYMKSRHSTDQGPHSLTDEGSGMYGLGLDINVESPDLVAPSFMKRLAAQELQRKQFDHTNHLKALLLSSMQKYDEKASAAPGGKIQTPQAMPVSDPLSSSFQALTRRDSEGDKDKYKSHSSQLSPRVVRREKLTNRENIDEDYPRTRSDSNPIRIKKMSATEPNSKSKQTILPNGTIVPSNVVAPVTVGSASPSRVSFASQSE